MALLGLMENWAERPESTWWPAALLGINFGDEATKMEARAQVLLSSAG